MDRVEGHSRALRFASPTMPASEPAAPIGPRAIARPWRCHACATLLGVERDGELHVKYKEAHYWIRGGCRHVCRCCGAMNVRALPASSIASGPTPSQGYPR
jgi:hypothetical protein